MAAFTPLLGERRTFRLWIGAGLPRYWKPDRLIAAVGGARTRPPCFPAKMSQGTANMEDHETRRKIIREWMALPKDKRQTEEQVAAFAKTAAEKNEFHRSRRDPSRKFRRDPYKKLMGWLLPRVGKS